MPLYNNSPFTETEAETERVVLLSAVYRKEDNTPRTLPMLGAQARGASTRNSLYAGNRLNAQDSARNRDLKK